MRVFGGIRLTDSKKSLRRTFAGLCHGRKQPGPGHSPVALGRGRRDAEDGGSLLKRQPPKVPELYELGLDRLLGGKLRKGIVECQQVLPGIAYGERFVQFDPLPVATMLGPPFSPDVLDKDAPHGLGGGGKKVSLALPVL